MKYYDSRIITVTYLVMILVFVLSEGRDRAECCPDDRGAYKGQKEDS